MENESTLPVASTPELTAQDSAEPAVSLPTVVSSDGEELTEATDCQTSEPPTADTANLVATASPEGEVRVMRTVDTRTDYVTRDELEALLQSAYLQGRNEAVRAQMASDVAHGTPTTEYPPMAADMASLFEGRPSVWSD